MRTLTSPGTEGTMPVPTESDMPRPYSVSVYELVYLWPALSAIDDKDERIFLFLDSLPEKLESVIAEVRDIHSDTGSG